MSAFDSLFGIFKKKSSPQGGTPPSKATLKKIKPYGDVLGDGAIQISFSLPVGASPESREAAKQYVEKMGLENVQVAAMESMGKNLSYFVVYGQSPLTLDFTKIKAPKARFEKMEREEVNQFIKQEIGKKLVVIGATTGTDAHTVGIDAIMNMKGYMGDYGLERYPCFKAINLRSQVSHDDLIRQAIRFKADAILVSKVVTQRGKYLEELKELAKMLKNNKKLKSPLIKIVGGPRMSHAQAAKLGYDAGFGPGTLPSEVASFLAQEYARQIAGKRGQA